MSFNPGENIGPYRIIEQLGQGGMATVYKAYHAALDRYVALKVLHTAFGEDPNFEARFMREARLVAKLEHPNIVPIYDYSEHDKRPFLVMKFIEGETLKARMARGPLDTRELTRIIEDVGSALSYAHKQGILHRDIKPSNVLLTKDGSVFLADFGLARIASAGESTLSGDMLMGTPQYISPEQAMGKKDLDQGTDIYSLGVMLYEMVVGQVPYHADTPFSIIHDHIYTPLPLPRKINPSVPESVERVLLKALSKERADRFGSVDELVEAFKQAWISAGVLMKGTTTILPHASPPASEKRKSVSKGQKEALPEAPTLTTPVNTSKKRKLPLWIMIMGVSLLSLGVLFAAYTLIAGRLIPWQAQEIPSAVPTVTPKIDDSTPVKVTPGDPTQSVQPITEAAPTATEIPAIQEALQAVTQSPNDAYAYLRLSLAYWDAGRSASAYETLNQGAELAVGNQGFFLDAAREFTGREAWLAAAGMYQRAILTRSGGEIPDDLLNSYHEAVYQAAASEEVVSYLPFDSIAMVDQSMAYIAEGRYNLYRGDIVKAREFLERVRRSKPGMPEIALLEAEIAFKEGQNSQARALLGQLLANLDTPNWIRSMADTLLLQNPN